MKNSSIDFVESRFIEDAMKDPNSMSIATPAPRATTLNRSRRHFVLAVLSLPLLSLAAAPESLAAADGRYDFKKANGSLRVEGKSVDIPEAVVKRLARVTKGDIVVRNNTIRLRKNAAARIVERVADKLDADVETEVRGPNFLVLEKADVGYAGRTSRPIVVTFEGDVFGEDFDGRLNTRVSATVRGKTLRMVFRFSGDADGADFSGRIVVFAKR